MAARRTVILLCHHTWGNTTIGKVLQMYIHIMICSMSCVTWYDTYTYIYIIYILHLQNLLLYVGNHTITIMLSQLTRMHQDRSCCWSASMLVYVYNIYIYTMNDLSHIMMLCTNVQMSTNQCNRPRRSCSTRSPQAHSKPPKQNIYIYIYNIHIIIYTLLIAASLYAHSEKQRREWPMRGKAIIKWSVSPADESAADTITCHDLNHIYIYILYIIYIIIYYL